MRKNYWWFFLLAGVLFICNLCGIPALPVARPTQTPQPSRIPSPSPLPSSPTFPPPAPTATLRPTESPLPSPTVPTGFTVIDLHPGGGVLLSQLEAEIARAAEFGQKPFVEFTAEW